jgi:hypothetical protein
MAPGLKNETKITRCVPLSQRFCLGSPPQDLARFSILFRRRLRRAADPPRCVTNLARGLGIAGSSRSGTESYLVGSVFSFCERAAARRP